MGTEGLLSPQVLWLLLWVQLGAEVSANCLDQKSKLAWGQ